MKIIDYPQYFSIENYKKSIERIIDRLSRDNNILSIYQIGGIHTPGISDIDLVIVLKHNSQFFTNPLDGIGKTDGYFYIHNLFGITESQFRVSQNFTFFHNYKLLYGKSIHYDSTLSEIEKQELKTQIAFEYLIKMYINLVIQKTIKIIKLRGLFLQVKALMYDLEFLDINSGKLYEIIFEFMNWRENWFDRPVENLNITTWWNLFYLELEYFLIELLNDKPFYLNGDSKISKNMKLLYGDSYHYKHNGITLPSILGILGTKYINLQHRFNTYEFYIPYKSIRIPEIINQYFEFNKIVREYNKENLPHFAPLTTSLNIST